MHPRRFIKIVVLVPLITLACVWVFNAILDPFGTSAISPLHYDRYPVAMDVNPWMYKAARIHQSTVPTAIFGDSTIRRLDPALILPSASDTIVNFAVPGDGLDGSRDVIEYASKDYAKRGHQLTRIVLGVSVYRFTEGTTPRLFIHNAAIINQPFWRYLNIQTTAASLADLRALLFPPQPKQPSEAARTALNEHESRTILRSMAGGNGARGAQLFALACSLQRRGVALTILVPPLSETLRQKINHALPAAYPKFDQWLHIMPHVVDYDTPGYFESDKDYEDLLHLHYTKARILLSDFLLDKPELAVEYRNPHACDDWSPSTDGAAHAREIVSRH